MGQPEATRRARLRQLVASMRKAKGEWVRAVPLLGKACLEWGTTMETAREYLNVLRDAEVVQLKGQGKDLAVKLR